jgi:hypothetical protein
MSALRPRRHLCADPNIARAGSVDEMEFATSRGSQFNAVEYTDKRSDGQEITGELVAAGCDAPPILDAAEEVFDFMSLLLEALEAMDFLDSGVTVRDGRQSAPSSSICWHPHSLS